MRILLVEDDVDLAKAISLMLASAKIETYAAETGQDGLEAAQHETVDFIILDINLPDMDGYEVLRRLRGERNATPVLILTGETSSDAIVKALSLGADDFLTKPFDREELIARIHAVHRRARRRPAARLKVGRVVVDQTQKQVMVEDRAVGLSPKEYDVIELLATRSGQVVTREAIVTRLYGGMDVPDPRIVQVFVCKLRNKLHASGARDYIRTVWGYGYKLQVPDADREAASAGGRRTRRRAGDGA